jgi:nitrite reductase/ring-hydroxylating ferredoxin subunit
MNHVGPISAVPPGTVTRCGKYALGNNSELFAVTRHCRHLGGPLDQGTLDADGLLVCPWHGAKYDVTTGQMVSGPQGVYAKVPGLGAALKALTRLFPLGRAAVRVQDSELYID